jgi:hypothetical protein
MLDAPPGRVTILYMLCGKVAAGKSTLAVRLADASATIVVAQDPWMAALYPEELRSIADYVRLVPRLRAAMGPHVSTCYAPASPWSSIGRRTPGRAAPGCAASARRRAAPIGCTSSTCPTRSASPGCRPGTPEACTSTK